MLFNYCFHLTLGVALTSALVGAKSFVAAEPAIQILNARAQYQGGWPLALSALNTTCPAQTSVQCNNGDVNPSCCPTGQFCVWQSSLFAFSCCPTADNCLVAVTNFPRCADTTWNMFIQGSSYFCCEPGTIGVDPKTGLPDGLCEAADQPVPTSLLATMATQIGGAKQTTVASNATQTGVPTQTNPSSSTDAAGNVGNTISHWSIGMKIGVGAAIVVFFIIFVTIISLVRRRRQRLAYQYQGFNQYDEYGNLIPQTGYRPGYEPYRRQNEGGVANNVTVNVVHGDQSS